MHTHTHTQLFNGPLSGTTQVGRYQPLTPILFIRHPLSTSSIDFYWKDFSLALHYALYFTIVTVDVLLSSFASEMSPVVLSGYDGYEGVCVMGAVRT